MTGDCTFVQAGIGAVERSCQDKMRENITVQDYGGVADGVTDISTAISLAVAAGAKRLRLPTGNYKLTSSVEIGGIELYGDGAGTVIDATSGTFVGGYALTSTGSLTPLPALAVDASIGDRSLTFATEPALEPGDVFCIFNPATSGWSGFRNYYYAGEWCEVVSISGAGIILKNDLYDSYAVTEVHIFKQNGPSPHLRDLTINGASSTGIIKASLCKNPKFKNITGTHAGNSILSISQCVGAEIHDMDLHNTGNGGDDYGVVIGNSQHVKISSSNLYSRRHAVTTGGGDFPCAVPCRDVVIFETTLKNDINSGVESGNFHGNAEDCRFVSCTSYGGITLAGKDVSAVNCIVGHNKQGSCYVLSEVKGGRFDIHGGRMRTFINPQTSNRGIIDIGGNSVTAVNSSTTLPFTLSVHDTSIYARNLSTTSSLIVATNRGSNAKYNILVKDVGLDVNQIGNIVYMYCYSGPAESDFIVVDGITGGTPGARLANLNNPFGAGYLGQPLRMQRQSGIVNGTTMASTSFIAPLIPLQYTYPRVPNAVCTLRGVNGGAMSTLDGQIGVPGMYQVTATQVRPMVLASNAFNGGTNFDLCWHTFIDEC